MNIHLAKSLVKEKVISLDQFKATIEEQRRTKKRLGEVLISLGYINESELVDFLSKEYGVPVVNLDEIEIDTAVLKQVPRKTVLEHGLIPIGRSGSNLVVAMSDPSNIIAVDDLRFATGYNIKPVVAPERAIRIAIERLFGADDEIKEKVGVEREEEQIEQILQEIEDVKKSIDELADSLLPEELESERPDDVPSFQSSGEQAVAPIGILSEGSEPDGSQEGVISQSAGVEQSTNQSSSRNFEAAETDINSEAVGEEFLNSNIVISQEHTTEGAEGVYSEGKGLSEDSESLEQAVLESGNEVEAFTPATLFSEGSKPEYSEEEAVKEPIIAEKIPDPFSAPLSVHGIEQKQTEVASEEEGFNPSSLFVDDSEPEPNSEEVVMESVVEDKISNTLSPVSASPDSESAPIKAEEGCNEEAFDPSSFFSQVYGNWEDQEQAHEQTIEEEKVIEQFMAPELSPECESDQPKDEVVIENDEQGNLFAHDYEPEHDQEDVGFASVNEDNDEDNAVDPFRAPTSCQDANTSPPTDESAADLKEKKYHSEPDGNFFIGTDVLDSTPSDTAQKEEKHVNDQVAVLHEETLPVTEPEYEFSAQKTVLVVDDSPTIQKIVAITLEREGYEVLTAANAMQALAKLNEVVPDLIFLDINLPHMDGYKLCRVINDLGLSKNVPIVMLSGKDGPFEEIRGKMAGAAGFITKPFESSTLIHTVEKYVS